MTPLKEKVATDSTRNWMKIKTFEADKVHGQVIDFFQAPAIST